MPHGTTDNEGRLVVVLSTCFWKLIQAKQKGAKKSSFSKESHNLFFELKIRR